MAERETRTVQGMILRLVPYRESDRILHLFTDEFGRMAAMARGARRSQRRFGGVLQSFVRCSFGLRSPTVGTLMEAVDAEPIESFAGVAMDPLRYGRAGYLCELVEVLTREADPHPGVLQMLGEALTLLQQESVDGTTLLRLFEVGLLARIGVWPEWIRCGRCGGLLTAAPELSWRPELGGLLCGRCGGEVQGALPWLMPRPLQHAGEAPMGRAAARLVGRCVRDQIRTLHPGPLRSIGFLRQLGMVERATE